MLTAHDVLTLFFIGTRGSVDAGTKIIPEWVNNLVVLIDRAFSALILGWAGTQFFALG